MAKKQPGTVIEHGRAYHVPTKIYHERRGLFELRIGPSGGFFFELGAEVSPPAERSAAMLSKAEQILKDAGWPIPADISDEALVDWGAKIHAQSGSLSIKSIAANLIITRKGIEKALVEKKWSVAEKLDQVMAFAAAWNAFHFETSGEHELAFGRILSVASQLKGAAATKEKGGKKKSIVRNEYMALAMREAGSADLASASKMASRLLLRVNEAFEKANQQHGSKQLKPLDRVSLSRLLSEIIGELGKG